MISENVNSIRNIIAETCNKNGRKLSDVTLVAVSKQKDYELILETSKTGIIDFGENRAKELKSKAENSNENFNWHFIGHLQTNKVKDVVPYAHLIHSVDNIKLCNEIDKRAAKLNKCQNILIEVNTSKEISKFGLQNFEEVLELATLCKDLQNVNLIGLMTMAPFTSDAEIIRKSFRSLYDIFVKLNNNGFGLSELSMGMTNDYQIAIEEGATILRIGTAIYS